MLKKKGKWRVGLFLSFHRENLFVPDGGLPERP
jgi:hypothetical protein